LGALGHDELLQFLNEMLEAERAGAKALLNVARDTGRDDIATLAKAIQKDEAKWCAMLTKAIQRLNGTPSDKTGTFYEKVIAIPDDKARLALVNRGQGWVVKKLREALPRIADAQLTGDLSVMLTSHEENIALVTGSGLAD
jgi:nitronate monooxygenase